MTYSEAEIKKLLFKHIFLRPAEHDLYPSVPLYEAIIVGGIVM